MNSLHVKMIYKKMSCAMNTSSLLLCNLPCWIKSCLWMHFQLTNHSVKWIINKGLNRKWTSDACYSGGVYLQFVSVLSCSFNRAKMEYSDFIFIFRLVSTGTTCHIYKICSVQLLFFYLSLRCLNEKNENRQFSLRNILCEEISVFFSHIEKAIQLVIIEWTRTILYKHA